MGGGICPTLIIWQGNTLPSDHSHNQPERPRLVGIFFLGHNAHTVETAEYENQIDDQEASS